MLTNNEKEILGYMVDMGVLRGQQRIEAGQDDTKAREFIAEFKLNMASALPIQIAALQAQQQHVEQEISAMQEVMSLLSL